MSSFVVPAVFSLLLSLDVLTNSMQPYQQYFATLLPFCLCYLTEKSFSACFHCSSLCSSSIFSIFQQISSCPMTPISMLGRFHLMPFCGSPQKCGWKCAFCSPKLPNAYNNASWILSSIYFEYAFYFYFASCLPMLLF